MVPSYIKVMILIKAVSGFISEYLPVFFFEKHINGLIDFHQGGYLSVISLTVIRQSRAFITLTNTI